MRTQKKQLPLQTLSLVAGFMVWVILSALMPFIKEDLMLTENEIAMVTAIPVVLGSVLRIPIGYWTNKYGARKLFSISFAFLLFPVYFISLADSYIDLLIGGLLVGVSGAIFSVGVTSLPKYYPKERHGFVNGIYGAGNLGTAVTTFSAPVIASQIGWQSTVRLYMVLLAAFALLNFFLGDKNEPKVATPLGEQIKSVYRNQKLWALSLFYFLTFGSFVAFTIYLPNFLVSHFELDKVDAGIRTAGFIALATFFRPIGGWLGDKFNSFVILMVVFAGMTISGILLSFTPSLTLYTIGCLAVAISAGVGNGTVFKLVPLYFSKQAGIVNGIVSAMGGLGGFFPPLMLAFLFNLTGHYAIGFMALSQIALASLIIVIWMYYQEKLSLAKNVIDHTAEGIMITDVKGMIEKVNQAFTTVTGYNAEEVIGKNPSVLRSGKHGDAFYKEMWKSINETGFWQGEIWNKKKNGVIYPEMLTISPVKNEAGEIKNFVGIFSELPAKNK
ncbi:MFS transporter [Mesobacillus thioparans]|uniref:nitrate/nitrite transporter n=1 Tax=Mesobacillus thioparans TaxID=370439 RepID=UPI0039F0C601